MRKSVKQGLLLPRSRREDNMREKLQTAPFQTAIDFFRLDTGRLQGEQSPARSEDAEALIIKPPLKRKRSMRQNSPVATIEYPLAEGKYLASKTDLKGRITNVNPHFIESSGFTEEELIGAPHNLVRYPDMPPEAFDDLWQTLWAGLPWTGLVKNRSKNGDYYWVEANVTLMMEAGVATGYLSVWTKPARVEVEQAEHAYRSMRHGNPDRLTVRRGQVARADLAGMLSGLVSSSLRLRVAGALATIALLFVAMGVPGFTMVDRSLGKLLAAAGGLGVMAIVLL